MRFMVVGQHTDILCPSEGSPAEKAMIETGIVFPRAYGLHICGELFRLFQRSKVEVGSLVFSGNFHEMQKGHRLDHADQTGALVTETRRFRRF